MGICAWKCPTSSWEIWWGQEKGPCGAGSFVCLTKTSENCPSHIPQWSELFSGGIFGSSDGDLLLFVFFLSNSWAMGEQGSDPTPRVGQNLNKDTGSTAFTNTFLYVSGWKLGVYAEKTLCDLPAVCFPLLTSADRTAEVLCLLSHS